MSRAWSHDSWQTARFLRNNVNQSQEPTLKCKPNVKDVVLWKHRYSATWTPSLQPYFCTRGRMCFYPRSMLSRGNLNTKCLSDTIWDSAAITWCAQTHSNFATYMCKRATAHSFCSSGVTFFVIHRCNNNTDSCSRMWFTTNSYWT